MKNLKKRENKPSADDIALNVVCLIIIIVSVIALYEIIR